MYIQRNPHPTNDEWWSQKVFLGMSRNTLLWIFFIVVIAIWFGYLDWDWVFGRW